MDYVPYNGYPAILHRGEAVLTSSEASDWRKGGTSGKATPVTLNAELTVDLDGATVARKIYKHLANLNEYHGDALIKA